jgi:2,3-bisphosphoglycerate-independent phosphoglycerate mutase
MSNGRTRGGPVVLVVLDGWGYRVERDGNAIELADTPVWHRLWQAAPRTLLQASGLAVGLPADQMGNSEVGHLNLGAGRVVSQDLVRISTSIESGEFYRIEPLTALCETVKRQDGTLHLVGLLGPGGVHAIDRHLLACLELGVRLEVPRIVVHGFLDGRDSPPTSGEGVVRQLTANMTRIAGGRARIATLVGRYYGMDRDRRWERTRVAYEAMVRGEGLQVDDPVAAVAEAYRRGETDEFVKPLIVRAEKGGGRSLRLQDGDGIVFFNYRADRMRQIVRALLVDGFDGFAIRNRPRLSAVTMTQYDQTFPLPQAFPPFTLANIVAEVLADHGRTQFRTAETEKYPHVSYFFNGGHEPPYLGEERCLIPSQRVATYDLAPEMSAAGITDALCRAIEGKSHDFILCNYANGDMVGHTGVMPAVIRAVECVDRCLGRLLPSAERADASVIITADHGNCELMIDPVTGGPHTAHTKNPVPLVSVGAGDAPLRAGGSLRDVGPTVLRLLGIEPPPEMTGRDLRLP